MAKKRFSESKSVNHKQDKFSDRYRNDQDPSQAGFFHGISSAENYMGMPVGMRGGLERDPMIHEDHRAIANMPQEVMIKAYPMVGPYMPEDLDDSSRAVDAQMNYDDAQREANFYPKKV